MHSPIEPDLRHIPLQSSAKSPTETAGTFAFQLAAHASRSASTENTLSPTFNVCVRRWVGLGQFVLAKAEGDA